MRNNPDVKVLDLKETQIAIKSVKDYFQRDLANSLNLARVTAPLIVKPETGLNDNLSGFEKAVSFKMHNYGFVLEVVQSLAKWKRHALGKYGFNCYEGLYTDMNAIRPFEEFDAIHSAYVDQWDWELIIKKEDRNELYLRQIVKKIYEVLKNLDNYVSHLYPMAFKPSIPDEIFFISSQDLEDMYPSNTPKERERLISKEHGAVFIMEIGDKLNSGSPHDLRSPDYDDWHLNGDIVLYNEVLDDAFEISSMGIRVDEDALDRQLSLAGADDRRELPYHQAILNKELPYTIGGGIGQSRLCMFFLRKRHIGEVQVSTWDDETIKFCEENGINLL